MAFQTHPRFILAVLSGVAGASPLSCAGSGGRIYTRLGDDVIMSGSRVYVLPNDSVPGDAILTGRGIEFSSSIGGDYLGAGGDQTIGGRIHGSVRAAGGNIHVSGAIDR